MRAAIYARVSTSNKGQSPDMQLREIGEYCERRGWIVTGEYVDVGISGIKEKRPELDRLMADAHRRRFDVVIVWKFDRFARSVNHLLRALETFNALGIAFVSLSEQMDTTTPTGKMKFTVLGAVAELERSLIVERVGAGLRNALAKGKSLGRPRKIVDAARIDALRAQGLSLRAFASELGVGACHAASRVSTPLQNSVKGIWNAIVRLPGASGPHSDNPVYQDLAWDGRCCQLRWIHFFPESVTVAFRSLLTNRRNAQVLWSWPLVVVLLRKSRIQRGWQARCTKTASTAKEQRCSSGTVDDPLRGA